MELRFQTKEESNRQQAEEFLRLSKSERVLRFFSLLEQINQFPTKHKEDKSANFQIEIKLKDW